MLAATVARSTIEPTTSVNGEASTSSPTAGDFPGAQRAHQCLAKVAGTSRDEYLHGREQVYS